MRASSQQTELRAFSTTISDIRATSNLHRFWSDFKGVLVQIQRILDCSAIIAVLGTGEAAELVCSTGLSLAKEFTCPEEQLLTRNHSLLEGAQHLLLQPRDIPTCCVTRQVLARIPRSNLVIFEKCSAGLNRSLHLFVFFESGVPDRSMLLLHEKKHLISQVVLETCSAFTHLEQISSLKTTLKDMENLQLDIAHQSQQILHGIAGYCDNLINHIYPPERSDRIFRYLREQVLSCSVFTNCILYAARGEADMFNDENMYIQPCALTKCLIEATINLQGYSETAGVSIHVEENTTDTIGCVLVDKDKFNLAVTNVLFNAVKYSSPNTQIIVSAKHDGAGECCEICVANRGIGIPVDKRKSIFDRGVRTDAARQYYQSGMGFGLFVTKQVMIALNGDVRVKDSLPTGNTVRGFEEHTTTFSILVPVSP